MVESSEMKRLRIGIDIDGVIVDYVTASLPLLSQICDRPISYQDINSRDLTKALGMGKQAIAYFWRQVLFTELLQYAPPIKGVTKALSQLDGHKLWLFTGRPKHLKPLTESWLIGNSIVYNRIVFDSGKTVGKLSTERNCDVFIEDQLEVAAVLAEAGVFTILLDQPWNQTPILPRNCIRVFDWDSIILQINNFEKV